MQWKVVVSLLGFAALCGVTTNAQEPAPKFDVFAGYSYVRGVPSAGSGIGDFSLNGGHASVAYHFNGWLSGIADFGAYHTGSLRGSGVDGTLSTYLFGPRVSYHRFRRITPFGEVLFGAAHAGTAVFNLFSTNSGQNGVASTASGNVFSTASSQNAFAMTVGGGVDYRVSNHLSIRAAQVDYLLTRFNQLGIGTQRQNNLRVSTGVTFRF
jgi:opacity protein-like surface antigen